MNDHPQLEDLDLYLLGGLEGEENHALEAHLSTCSDCRRKLAEARGLLALVSGSAPALAPPARARQRILESVREPHSEPRPVPRQEPGRSAVARPGFWTLPNLVWAFAVFAAVLGASLVSVENRRLAREQGTLRSALGEQAIQLDKAQAALDILRAPETQRVRLVSGTERPVPEGKVFYHAHRGLLFFASNLPPLEGKKAYELWLIPAEGKPINAGVFQTDSRGEGNVLLPALPPHTVAKAFAVTIEPAGGVDQPTGPKVLVGGV